MKLNHINLSVTNVTEAVAFFELYFNFRCEEVKGEHALAVLKGEYDFTLVLMSEAFNRNGNTTYPEAFHIGFIQESREKVEELYQRLIDGGITVERKPAPMRGVYGFYFRAPGNILTEISCAENNV